MDNNKYLNWIKNNIPVEPEQVLGKCKHYCEKMIKEFPELTLTRGHFLCMTWGPREHWWLQVGDIVVDPTVHQFPTPSKHIGASTFYAPLPEGHIEPVGMCPNCGDYVYPPRSGVCSDSCEREYLSYLNSNCW